MSTVSTSAFFERANLQLGGLRRQAERYQAQIGTGSRLVRSSDDPVAAARMRDLARQNTLAKVDTGNSDNVTAQLQTASGAISQMSDMVIRARELAMQASNETLSANERVSIGDELASLRDALIGLANTRDGFGNALFGGQITGKAYQPSGNGASYSGTAQAPSVDLGDGQAVTVSVTGPELFEFTQNGTPTDLFATIGNLAAALQGGSANGASLASNSLDALDTGLGKLTTSQTIIGSRIGWVETLAERRTDRSETIAQEQANVGGADLALTITRLQETMTVLEASQASFVKLANLSLFSLLR